MADSKFNNIFIIDLSGNFEKDLVDMFIKHNFNVLIFNDKNEFFDKFEEIIPDLIVLNIYISDINIFSICSKVRSKSTVPFIVTSNQASEEQIITALNICCDDYFVRPFFVEEVFAKILSIFRRIDFESKKCNMNCSYSYGNLYINLKRHEVLVNSETVYLTSKEYEVLIYLLENIGNVVNRDELLLNIWGFDSGTVETRAIDDCIKRLRKKLSDSGSNLIIETVRGYGFKIKL